MTRRAVALRALLPQLCLLASPVGAFRAAWIPSSFQSTTSADLCSQLEALQAVGVDRVYLDVWNNGAVYFASATMAAAVPSAVRDDRLAWAANDCTTFHGEVHAWFEYGLMAAYGDSSATAFATYAEAQGWVLGQDSGWTWLNASETAAVDFVGSLVAEALTGYPNVRGAQLDDHFSQPVALAGHDTDAMTAAAVRLTAAVRTAVSTDATTVVALSPSPLDQALATYNVDWRSWGAQKPPLFDEFVPQLYRSTYSDFAPLLNATLSALYPDTDHADPFLAELAVGLRGNGAGAATAWSELELMLDDAEAARGLSPSLWYSSAVVDLYPAELAAYWQ